MTLAPSTSPCGPADDDAPLLTAVASGDPVVLRALHNRYSTPAWAVARHVLVDENLAQDLVQDVFLTLWRHADRYDRDRRAVPSLAAHRHPPPGRRRGYGGRNASDAGPPRPKGPQRRGRRSARCASAAST
jgi:hypothetical protein